MLLEKDVQTFFSLCINTLDNTICVKLLYMHEKKLKVCFPIFQLQEVIYRLPFFTKYSRSVKEKLAQVVWYDQFENDRIIIRQGDLGSRMYFVISGYASVQRTDIDPRTSKLLINAHTCIHV